MAIDTHIRPTGETLYAIYVQRSSGQVWNAAEEDYEAITLGNFADYDVPLAATGFVDVNDDEVYSLAHPAGLTSEVHDILIWKQAGGGPVMANDQLVALGEAGRGAFI